MTNHGFGIRQPDDFSPLSDKILEKTLLYQFEKVVEKYPQRLAVKDTTQEYTYQELNNAINSLAFRIIGQLGDDKTQIAFMFNRELKSIIALLAIMKSGNLAVGLYSSYSEKQIQTYLTDSCASLLITSSTCKKLDDDMPLLNKNIQVIIYDHIDVQTEYENPTVNVALDDTYCIVYTSGSTGKPNGVMMGQANRLQSVHFTTNNFYFSPSDRFSLVTSVCFASSHPSLFGALLNGGLLCILNLKTNKAHKALDWLMSEKITYFHAAASILRTIFNLSPSGMVFSNLRLIRTGGEPILGPDLDLFKKHTEKDCVLVNVYGSTEAGYICGYPVQHNHPPIKGLLPAGYPAPGLEILILDDTDQPVKFGKVGEIVVRSKHLNPGYWRQAEITTKKFRTDHIDSAIRMYHTGDLGRFREDGVLEIIGREDAQVKIRGYRINLYTIDSAILELPDVLDAATIVFGDPGSSERLAAYLSLESDIKIQVSHLRKALAVELPEYMIPSVFIQLESIPRSATGKLSRKDLPKPKWERPEITTPYIAPSLGLESDIAEIWREILEVDKVGVDDNFFDLGGDSLMVLEMDLELERCFSIALPQVFFQNPTIDALAQLIKSNHSPDGASDTFSISSYRKNQDPGVGRNQIVNLANKVKKKIINRNSSLHGLDILNWLRDKLVTNFVVSRSYERAQAWAVYWSGCRIVQRVLYFNRRKLFIEWLADLSKGDQNISGSFQLNILNNMFIFFPKDVRIEDRNQLKIIEAYKKSGNPFWQSLGILIDKKSIDQLEIYFPMLGLKFLNNAYRQGRGVILVSYHGLPRLAGLIPLSKIMGVDEISVISYKIPRLLSKYDDEINKIFGVPASTLNAEIALYGQKKLQAGKIIFFASDGSDLTGRIYQVSMGGRRYQMKAGFAEMALNTGAVIIPLSRYCLPDGRIQTEFFPPLLPGEGERQDQVENLIQEYTEFVEHSWFEHPESINWRRMKQHLERLPSEE